MSGIIAQNTLDGSGLIKSPEGGGAWNFISKTTASGDATIDITSGIDSTYKTYVITLNNIHPEGDNRNFRFNLSEDGGSNYNVTKTSTSFVAYHSEGGAGGTVGYDTGYDLAQGTGVQPLLNEQGADNDQCCAIRIYLFDPSNTTYVKHFLCESMAVTYHNYFRHMFIGGYANTTSAVDAIQFSFSADNIDAGDICLYGIST